MQHCVFPTLRYNNFVRLNQYIRSKNSIPKVYSHTNTFMDVSVSPIVMDIVIKVLDAIMYDPSDILYYNVTAFQYNFQISEMFKLIISLSMPILIGFAFKGHK